MPKCLVILFAILLLQVQARLSKHQIGIPEFLSQDSFQYVTRMGFASGTNEINVTMMYAPLVFRLDGQHRAPHDRSLSIGLVTDADNGKLHSSYLCQTRELYFQHRRSIQNLEKGQPRFVSIKFNQSSSEKLWYLYLYNCNGGFHTETDNNELQVQIEVVMINNQSHFSDEEDSLLWIYIGALMVAATLLPNSLKKLKKDLKQDDKDWAHILIFVGVMGLTASYIYKIVHLLKYSGDGVGYPALDLLATAMKTASESTVVSLLVMIASGWGISHLDSAKQRKCLHFGLVAVLWNLCASVLSTFTDGNVDKHHYYDCGEGLVILAMRSLIIPVFLVNANRTYQQAKPKTRKFIRDFSLLGFIYLAAYPIAVGFCQLTLPTLKQHEGITAITEMAHIAANGLLTYMVTSRRSSYKALEYGSRTLLTPIDMKFF